MKFINIVDPYPTKFKPLKIALIYFIISFLLIFFSDQLVESLFPNTDSITFLQTIKGMFFITITSIIIYFLINIDIANLVKQKSLLKNIVDTSPVGIVMVNPDGAITFANNEAELVLGLKKKDIQSRTYNAPEWKITTLDGSPFPDDELPFSKVKKFKRQFKNIEHAIEYPNNKRTLLSINAAPIVGKKESFEGMIATVEDITEKKSAADILLQKNEQLINTLESMSDGFVAFDTELNYTYINQHAGKLLGRNPEDLVGKNYWVEYPEAKGSPFANNYVKALETQEPIIFEDYYSPWERWFENRIYPSDKGLSIFFQDINERKKSEATLRKWEEIFKNAQWGVAVSSRDGKNLAMINPAFASMHGFTIEELINKPILDVYVPDSRAELPNHIRLANERGFHSFESYHLRKDGTTFPVQMDLTVVKDEKGEMQYRIVNCLDITDRKKAEQKRAEIQQQLQGIIDNSESVIYMFDVDGSAQLINNKFESLFTIPKEEMIGKVRQDFMPKEIAEQHRNNDIEIIHAKKPITFEETNIEQDGLHYYLTQKFPLLDSKGNVYAVGGISTDITDRKKAELLISTEAHVLELIAKQCELPIILEKIVAGIETILEDTIASILLLDEDGVHVHYGAAPNLPKAYNDAIEGAPIGPKAGSCGTAMFIKKPVIVSDIRTDPLWDDYRELANKFGLRACWSTPIMDSDGNVFGSFAMYYKEPRSPKSEDLKLINRVTALTSIAIEHNKTESALKESNHYNRLLFETSVIGLALCRMDGSLVDINPTFANIIGRSIDESLKLSYWDITPEKYSEQEKFHLDLLEKTGNYGPYEKEYIHKDGHFIPVRLQGQIIERKGEKFIWSTVEDITERKRAEEELKASEIKYRSFFENSMDAILLTDPTGKIYSANSAACEMLCRTEEEIIEAGRSGVFDLSDPRLPILLEERQRKGKVRGELTMVRKDGTKFPAELSSALFIVHESNVRTSMIIRDITERREAEEELKNTHQQYRQALTQVKAVPYQRYYHENKYSFIGEDIFKYTGYSAKEFRPSLWNDLRKDAIMLGECSGLTIEEAGKELRKGKKTEWLADYKIKTRSGEIKWLNDTAVQIKDQNGKIIGSLGVLQDITERKRIEEEIKNSREELRNLTSYLQTVREEERAAIAREIHDELGQVLTSLKMNLVLMQREISSSKTKIMTVEVANEISTMTKIIDASVIRLRNLITRLRPEILDKLGLVPALKWYTKEINDSTKIKINFKSSIKVLQLKKEAEISVFRILQESLTNIVKHSQATKVNVTLEKKRNELTMKIEDNGIGFDQLQHADQKTFGLIGMKERARLIDAEFNVSSKPGKGTQIKLTVKL
jgi:PAS domain S-box-containing protein